jgi:hypothetical protein
MSEGTPIGRVDDPDEVELDAEASEDITERLIEEG